MQTQDIAPYPNTDGPTQGVYVADGYGIKIQVRNKHLIVADGIGSHRREQRFHKATSGLRRLVVLGHTGFVTFEALRWMTDAKVGYLQLDRDGTILATTGALGVHKAELRRHQALAATNTTGINLTRWILQLKLEGQAEVADRFSTAAADEIRNRLSELDTAPDLESLRWVESQAARTYWDVWNGLPVTFVTADQSIVADHWTTFGTRGSRFGTGGRRAVNPANALLNYLYALLEAETTLACSAAGLDPGIGVLHADRRERASLSLDIMEAVRPTVDNYLLDLIDGHVFRRGDFRETRKGVCRINPPLSHHLAQTVNYWYDLVAPIIEKSIRTLTSGNDKDTHLTRSNQRPNSTLRGTVSSPLVPRIHCLECGEPTLQSRKLCDKCADQRRGVGRLEKLVELRSRGQDPAHGGTAAKLRGATNRDHQIAVAEWNRSHSPPDRKAFEQEILPALKNVKIEAMVAATGLSAGYCSFIRRGTKVPHPRHWLALEHLIQESVPSDDGKK